MPRKSSGRKEAQRQRQEKYRERLAVKGEAETGDLDTALAASIAAFVNGLEAVQDRLKANEVDQAQAILDRAELRRSKELMDFLLNAGVEFLGSQKLEDGRQKYSTSASRRLMRRRLVWLKESLKNPAASTLQKRGFSL